MNRKEELRNYMKAARALFVFDDGFGKGGRAQKEVDRAQFDDGGGRHLSNDEMIAFCQERMAAAEREAARPHILQCDECLQLFKDVNDFFAPRREDEVEIGELHVRRAWKEFWPQARDIIGSSRGGLSRAAWLMAAAAGLLLMLGLAAVFVWHEREGKEQAQRQIAPMQNEQSKPEAPLGQIERNAGDQPKQERKQRAQAEARAQARQKRLNDLQQARQDIPTYTLMLASEKGIGDDSQLSIPATVKTFRLKLIINKPSAFPKYSIELLNQQGWSVAERLVEVPRPIGPIPDSFKAKTQRVAKRLVPRPIGSGYVLNRSELPAGDCSLLLYGHRGKSKRNLGEYLGEYEVSVSFSR